MSTTDRPSWDANGRGADDDPWGAADEAPSTAGRAIAAAAARVLGARAGDFLRRVGLGDDGVAERAARLGRDGAALARECARLDGAPPEGIERVHPSWWQRPPASSRPAARAYLERAATAHLVPMPPPAPWSAAAPLASLDALSPEALERLVRALGRRRVAVAFSDTPRPALAQLCARLGEPAASELVAEVRAVRPTHDEVRAAQRALFKLAVDATDARSLLVSAGARWLAPALAARGGDVLRRVAQRLPIAIGRALLAEAGAAATSDDHAWCAQAVAALAR